MSLIHEALKRAEQQRQLGEPPTLATPFGVAPRRRSIVPILLPLIGVALLAGWWLLRTPAPIASAGSTSQPIAAPTGPGGQRAAPAAVAKVPPSSMAADRKPSAARTGPESVSGADAGPRGFASVPARPTIKDIAERESEPRPAGANPLAPGEAAPQALSAQAVPDAVINDPADVAVKSASKRIQGEMPVVSVPAPASTTAALPPPAAASSKSGNMANVAKDAKVAAPAKPAGASVVAASPPAAIAPPPPVTTAPATAAQVAVPMLWQLPLNVRKDLPELKLTMHVYSAEPAQRFVVLNGNRQVEGDELGADVKLNEIRVDGAVLEFHGQRFMVPRGGS